MKNLKCISVLIFTLLFITATLAQPTITSSWVPSIGTSYTLTVANGDEVDSPGDEGANITWDFSAITPVGAFTITNQVVSPGSTPYSSEFPDATLAFKTVLDSIDAYNFQKVSSNKVEDLGSGVTGFGHTIFDDPATVLEFPFTYQSSFEDSYSSIGSFMESTRYVNGDRTVTCDAYGTLKLPGKDYPNVLRIKTEQNNRDSTAITGISTAIIREETTYSWYNPADYNFIASFTVYTGQDITYIPGFPPVIIPVEESKSFSFTLGGAVNVDEVNGPHSIKSVYPMPFNEHIVVQINSKNAEKAEAVLYDLNGQIVLRQDISLFAGLNKTILNTNTILPGAYILEVGKDANRTVQKVFKQ